MGNRDRKAMTDAFVGRIPLFPLGVVLLPRMELPLHIFEPRYRQMIAECLEEDKGFGIVLFDGERLHPVGCMARIQSVLRRFPDGRLDILARGFDRFLIRGIVQKKAYMEADIVFFEDMEEPGRPDCREALEDAGRLLDELAAVDPTFERKDALLASDPGNLSFAIAALDGFTPAERQRFLEMPSAAERLEKAVRALSVHVRRLELTREIHHIIGGNGSLPPALRSRLGDLS